MPVQVFLFMIPMLTAVLAFGQSSNETFGGTLNLVLANHNGIVVATDSRRSSLNGQYWDDSQKLFRIGKRSALAIAGFAAALAPGTPMDVQVAALLREHFQNGERRDLSFDDKDVSGWMRVTMTQELQVVGGVFGALGVPNVAKMTGLAAGYDAHGKPKITRFEFDGENQTFGPSLINLPVFDVKISSTDINGFTWATAGIDTIAKSILMGTYLSADERIVRFHQARDRQALDNLPLDNLRELGQAILSATENSTQLVGGPDQICVLPRSRKAECIGPRFPSSKQKVLRTILWLGGPTNVRRMDGQHFSLMSSIYDDLSTPASEQYTQVFLAGAVQDVDVSLDGNFFAGFQFVNVTFKYKGGSFFFENNSVQQCEVEVEEGESLPATSPLLTACHITTKARVDTDAFTVGVPMNPEYVGCVIRKPDGTIRMLTTGKYKGRDCRGSHIQLKVGIPIPGTRASRNLAGGPP